MILARVAAIYPSQKIPRYHLQRLYRRCSNGCRQDLVLPLLVAASEMYPSPPKSKVISHESAFWNIQGFNPNIADEDMFRFLVLSDEDEMGEHFNFLLDEARIGGWLDETDRNLSALLSLQNNYGFNANFTMGGRSMAPMTYMSGRERRELESTMSEHSRAFPADETIDGVNGGYLVLAEAIQQGFSPGVRRLVRLGIDLERRSKDSFFWRSMDAIRDHLRELGTDDYRSGTRIYQDEMASHYNGAEDLRTWYNDCFGRRLPFCIASDDAIFDAQVDQLNDGFKDFLEFVTTDAIRLTTSFENVHEIHLEPILRTLLERAQETGWLQTETAKQSMAACCDIALQADKIRLVNLLQQYTSGPAAENLDAALFANDVVNAAIYLAEGQRISDDQKMVAILRSRSLHEVQNFLLLNYPFTPPQLISVLTSLINDPNQFDVEDRDRLLTTAIIFLNRRRDVLDDVQHRSVALGWFDAWPWTRRLLRPCLGPLDLLNTRNNHQSVLQYDLLLAVHQRNEPQMRRLLALGAYIDSSDFPTYFPHLPRELFGLASTFIDGQQFSAGHLGEILLYCLHAGHYDFAFRLLTRDNVQPTIGDVALRHCMTKMRPSDVLLMFALMVDIAGKQDDMIDGSQRVRNMALHRGGEWESAWLAYEQVYA